MQDASFLAKKLIVFYHLQEWLDEFRSHSVVIIPYQMLPFYVVKISVSTFNNYFMCNSICRWVYKIALFATDYEIVIKNEGLQGGPNPPLRDTVSVLLGKISSRWYQLHHIRFLYLNYGLIKNMC
jgi:hypothetical protein